MPGEILRCCGPGATSIRTARNTSAVAPAQAGAPFRSDAEEWDPRLRGDDVLKVRGGSYFFDGAGAAAPPAPGARKYLKNSEPESSTITSP